MRAIREQANTHASHKGAAVLPKLRFAAPKGGAYSHDQRTLLNQYLCDTTWLHLAPCRHTTANPPRIGKSLLSKPHPHCAMTVQSNTSPSWIEAKTSDEFDGK